MPSTVVRPARPEDAESACEIIRRSIIECCVEDHHHDAELIDHWLRNKTPASVRGWLEAEPNRGVVVERNDEVVGFGLAAPGEIKLCYVTAPVRFTGAGKALLHALESSDIHAEAQFLSLESTQTAKKFYERHGYVAQGDPINAFGLTAQPMRKPMATLTD